MSEARSFDPAKSPPSRASEFKVIDSSDTQGPAGSFFDAKLPQSVREAATTYQSKVQRALLESGSAQKIVISLIETTTTDNEARADFARRIKFAEDFYRSQAFWQDFTHRTGLNTERVFELYERAEPFAGESDIHETLRVVQEQNRENYHIADALRVTKLLIIEETQQYKPCSNQQTSALS